MLKFFRNICKKLIEHLPAGRVGAGYKVGCFYYNNSTSTLIKENIFFVY
jgi:hypothetical protein